MMPNFDPSKMDPKLLMEMTQMLQQLPPEQLMKMQTLMHNMMAGFDVSREMEEFEKSLPPGFRDKLFRLITSQGGAGAGFGGAEETAASSAPPIETTVSPMSDTEMNLREARLTILRAVAGGRMSPEEAEHLLFPG